MNWSRRRAASGVVALLSGILVVGLSVTAHAVPAGSEALGSRAAEQTAAMMRELEYQVIIDDAAGNITVQEDGTIVQRIGDQQMVLDQDGSWSIGDIPENRAITGAAWVSGCAGSFGGVIKVRNYLQSGATQTCSEGAYPQWIRFQLRSTCSGPLCIRFSNETGKIRSNNGLGYSRVANVTYTERCKSSGKRKYSQVVWPAGRGVEFGPVVDRKEPVVACDLNA
ncbi:hypothetical protein ACO229_14740 [Promicromonospora sp. MS192]|uniref:hypothetical protein n=1 Tax=Promicromonospora sp. MS192 TaxID=3412684 RepID=UPI003C2C1B1D